MAKRWKVSFKRPSSVTSVVSSLFAAVITLYVGGTMMTELGTAMNGTTSAFYKGLTLIGWTVSASNQITATATGGVLTVVGLIAIAAVILQFVRFQRI